MVDLLLRSLTSASPKIFGIGLLHPWGRVGGGVTSGYRSYEITKLLLYYVNEYGIIGVLR